MIRVCMVATTSIAIYGCNYFNCASAIEVEDEDVQEHALILSDILALRKATVGYAHPEVGVSSSDQSMHGCNDFNRLFAPEESIFCSDKITLYSTTKFA